MRTAYYHINPATTSDDISAVAALFSAYVKWLDIDLTFQDFETELSALPGKYAPPAGELWLARHADGTPIGCIALRPLDSSGICEIKRLYVTPQARGLGLGRALIATVLLHAKKLGYGEARLDTLDTMVGPLKLYREAGFVDIAPYYETPVPNTVFLARTL